MAELGWLTIFKDPTGAIIGPGTQSCKRPLTPPRGERQAAATESDFPNPFLTLPRHVRYQYVVMKHMTALDRQLKKGSTELLVLSLVENRARHGYEIGKLIETRSRGALKFNVASLYPLLYRLEARGLIEGRWVEKASQRRRRYYKLTAAGRKMLRMQQSAWAAFVEAMTRITEAENA